MGKKTGKPKGRPPGAKNKRTAEREAAMKAAEVKVNKLLGRGAFKGDAHALLMMVYKDDEHDIELRIDAAKGAIRFEKPALSSVDANLSGALTIEEVNFVVGR